MDKFLTLDDFDPKNKRILVRLDLNVPIKDGKILDLTRLKRSLPTLRELASKGARVIVLSHLGRPQGEDPNLSLAAVAHALKEATSPIPVSFCPYVQGPRVLKAIDELQPGHILLLENIRFVNGEEKNDPHFVEEMSHWADVYVNDAFSASHRAHASTEGIAHFLPAYAGRLMEEELKALQVSLESAEHPLMAIVGGAKVSTKLPLLENLLSKVDVLVIGGAMANTFLAAQKKPVGKSIYEPELTSTALDLMGRGADIVLPVDVVVAQGLETPESVRTCRVAEVKEDEMILDVGPLTCDLILDKLKACKTLLWNGPLGYFEVAPFSKGTRTVAQGAAQLTREAKLISVAGGGDTVSALSKSNVLHDFTYVSTAGGAFLEWLEGKPLPGVVALYNQQEKKKHAL